MTTVDKLNEIYSNTSAGEEKFDEFNKTSIFDFSNEVYRIEKPLDIIFLGSPVPTPISLISIQKTGICCIPFGFIKREGLEKKPFVERGDTSDLTEIDNVKDDILVWYPKFGDTITSSFDVSFPHLILDLRTQDVPEEDSDFSFGAYISSISDEGNRTKNLKMKGIMVTDFNKNFGDFKESLSLSFSKQQVNWKEVQFPIFALWHRKVLIGGAEKPEKVDNLLIAVAREGFKLGRDFNFQSSSYGTFKVDVPLIKKAVAELSSILGATPESLLKTDSFWEGKEVAVSDFQIPKDSGSGSGSGSDPIPDPVKPQRPLPPPPADLSDIVPANKDPSEVLEELVEEWNKNQTHIKDLNSEKNKLKVTEKEERHRMDKKIEKKKKKLAEIEEKIVRIYNYLAIPRN